MAKIIQNHRYIHPTNFDFENLCMLLSEQQYTSAVTQIKTLTTQISLDALHFDKHSYTRNIIIDNKDYWLGLLYWDKSAITPIHGHPECAFVYVVAGQLTYKEFDKNPPSERSVSTLSADEYCQNNGIKGKLDNHIHQMSANEKSLSLHFYSDNPSKGEVFDI